MFLKVAGIANKKVEFMFAMKLFDAIFLLVTTHMFT